jgi:arsenical pump membrane protein
VFGLAISILLLLVVLSVAVTKPRRPPDWSVAVGAAALVLAVGAVSWHQAMDELRLLAPVLVFLAAVLVLGAACAHEGVFRAVGGWLAGSRGGTGMLLVWVFVVAAAVTSVLSLDATVVLLTPVVLSAAGQLGVSPRPYVYATAHVANSGSLLLPTGNLTNLLALNAAGLTVVHFAALMVLPWLLVLAVEYGVLRTFFRADIHETSPARTIGRDEVATPWFALVVLALTLAGFVTTSFAGIQPYWAAIAGALVLAAHAFSTGKARPVDVARPADVPFLVFVLGLAVVVRATVENGLGGASSRLLPADESFLSLLVMATVATVLANVVNNLPALLILLPTAGSVGSLAVLAVLIGVNVGPNLTYPGSLATLLWRRVLREHGLVPSLRRFTVLGLATVPAAIVVGVAGLWLGGQA